MTRKPHKTKGHRKGDLAKEMARMKQRNAQREQQDRIAQARHEELDEQAVEHLLRETRDISPRH